MDGAHCTETGRAWHLYRVLNALCSTLMVAAFLVSIFETPNSPWSWRKAIAGSTSPGKGQSFEQGEREEFRVFQGVCVVSALVLDLSVLRYTLAARTPPKPLYMPRAHAMLSVLRLAFAVSDVVLVFPSHLWGDVWVNPGLGMYGWSTALGGFPFHMTFDNYVHIVLALGAAASYATLSRVDASQPTWNSQPGRAFLGAMMVLSVWYPVYDSKHPHACDRYANALGAYLILYFPLAAASDLHRCWQQASLGRGSPGQAAAPDGSSPAQAPRQVVLQKLPLHEVLDVQQALLLILSTTMLLVQLFATTFCWASPATQEPEDKLPELARHWFAFGQLYKPAVVWGLDLAGAVVIFAVTEVLAARATRPTHSQPMLGV